jgi:hypothetical protein
MLRRLLGLFRRNEPASDGILSQQEAHAAVLSSGGEATHSVVLRLDPAAMEKADLEVRWDLERTLRKLYPDIAFYDDGYGFARHSEAMFLDYATRQPDQLVAALVDLIENNKVSGYAMAAAAIIAVAPAEDVSGPGEEWINHRIVYPPHEAGKPVPD